MDPVTHGITGALIGKAFFSQGNVSTRAGAAVRPLPRAAVWVVAIAAMFPDVDVAFGPASRSLTGTLEFHRWVTHSLLCLPVFAIALAWLARWWLGRRAGRLVGSGGGERVPSFWMLAAMCAVGLASHIGLDVVTSWGTMVWSPLDRRRVAYDLVFILDLALTGIVLVPQLAAWAAREPGAENRRGLALWLAGTAFVLAVERLTSPLGIGISIWGVAAATLVLAGIFLLPPLIAERGSPGASGRGLSETSWCRAGIAALGVYLVLCAAAQREALEQVREFAAENRLEVENLGALPVPPSLVRWSGMVRTPGGVYQAVFNVAPFGLWETQPPVFHFVPDTAPPDRLTQALALPEVQTYLWFARFPVMRAVEESGLHGVEFSDLRFFIRGTSRPAPYLYRVWIDDSGRVVEQGWAFD